MSTTKNKIIIAPLNWGLGHATRCVPIINALLENNYQPIIASDGSSLEFLKKEFSNLEFLELPSYNISYHKNLKLTLLLQIPRILATVKKEQEVINNFINANKDVIGVISDNRFGVRSKVVPSIYITHQVNVLSGFTTVLTSKVHQKIINKFDQCWIPDHKNGELSGRLSKIENSKYKFIGALSRFSKTTIKDSKVDVLVVLSGVEPNRTLLEHKLISEFKNDARNIVFVLGKVENDQKKWTSNNSVFYNFLLSKELEQKINEAEIVICRSGYSSILDLYTLEKKVFFIPTKNQPEQEYLAKYLEQKGIAPFANLEDFNKKMLNNLSNYTGFKSKKSILSSSLFSLFHGKRKL
ncbi:glycosyltransferase [Polaribacter sp.]|uniref:glycosyltransferase n=1 Tax=Polaribacter sp. TaxID=1920175 RepID=UPI0035C85B4F